METVPVTDGRGLDRFIAFPFDLHRHDPLWVPPLRRDVRTLLTPGRNPFFQHGEARCFLAVRDGRTVGRIAAIRNDEHQRVHHDKVGFYGFFESVDDQPVATALFDTAAAWLRTKGFDTMRGPMSPSINDECGLLVDGFDTPPVIMMTHNPRYYVPLHERYGFVKAKDLIAYEGSGTAPPERIVRAAQLLAERKGITLRPLNMKRFREEVTLVKSLFNRAWEHNWGFIPMTEAELDFLADQLKPIIIPDMVCIAELKGTVVGFGLAIPDMNAALRHNRSGRLFPLGLVRILWYSRRNHRARIPLLGTVPEFRGRGVDALMYHWIWTRSNAHGFTWGEAGWFLEDNHAIINAAVHLGFHAYKTYRIYDKPL